MKKQTYIRHLIGYTLIFFGFWKFLTHLIPNIIHHPQNYLWSNYPSQLTESDFDETDALEGEEV